MENLLVCESCRHGGALHSGLGCEARSCACKLTLHQIIDDGIEATRLEIGRQWEQWTKSGDVSAPLR